MKARSSDWRVILKSLNTGKTGRIVFKAGSNKLYYDFCYDGKRYEKTTGLQFSVENALQARKTLDDMMGEIQAGTFCFAARFPDASPVSLTLHAQQESRSKAKRPDQITIAEFINGTHDCKGWLKETLPLFDQAQQIDYARDIRYWLIPLYGHLMFAELTGHKLHSSLSDYKRYKMENGPLLSGIRIKNIFTPLRLILGSARSKYGWRDLKDPFQYLEASNLGPKRKENPTPALLFMEFVKLRMHLDDYDQRIADMKALTGMIDSEMSGLRKTDIFFDAAKPYLHIRHKVVNSIESDELKTNSGSARCTSPNA